MSVDFLAYHSLLTEQASALAAQDSAFWAKISCLVAVFGVFATFCAAAAAFITIRQWNKGIKEEKKNKLIESLVAFNKILVDVPKNILKDCGENNSHRRSVISSSMEVLARYVIYSNSFQNADLKSNMDEFRRMITDFLAGKELKIEISLITGSMLMDNLAN
ncbi:hypothetical protein CVQ51_22465 [Salmonella enterica]|nr:hypothetical protein [Salmonella enterica]